MLKQFEIQSLAPAYSNGLINKILTLDSNKQLKLYFLTLITCLIIVLVFLLYTFQLIFSFKVIRKLLEYTKFLEDFFFVSDVVKKMFINKKFQKLIRCPARLLGWSVFLMLDKQWISSN